MKTAVALSILSALAHPARLATFRLLIEREPDGLSTGHLVAASGLTQSTFSTHLAVLANAGLIVSQKRGRHKIQHISLDTLGDLVRFLLEDCCQGHPRLAETLRNIGRPIA